MFRGRGPPLNTLHTKKKKELWNKAFAFAHDEKECSEWLRLSSGTPVHRRWNSFVLKKSCRWIDGGVELETERVWDELLVEQKPSALQVLLQSDSILLITIQKPIHAIDAYLKYYVYADMNVDHQLNVLWII